MFDGIRILSTKEVKPTKPHKCVMCNGKIEKGMECNLTTFVYDGKIINVYICFICSLIKTHPKT